MAKKFKKKLYEGKDLLKQLLLKDTFAGKRYGKGHLYHIKEEEVYKVQNREFTNGQPI